MQLNKILKLQLNALEDYSHAIKNQRPKAQISKEFKLYS